MMDNFRNARCCQPWSVQVPSRGCRQDDRQVRRNIMQRRREIERGSGAALVAYKRRVEAGVQGMGLSGLGKLRESDRLGAEGRQNFLMPQQALAFGIKHQHRFTSTTTGRARRVLNGYRLIGRYGWKPDVETRSNPGSTLHLNGSVMFLDDFTNRCKPETVAVGTRRKERLENPLQRCSVHAAPGIQDRQDCEATGTDVNTSDV